MAVTLSPILEILSYIYLCLPSFSSQGSVLQLCASTLSPAQQWPPFAGGGLVQVLLRSFIPPPHGTLHSLQSPKSLHPPCTAPGLRPERQLLKWSGKVLYLNTDYVSHNSIALLFGLIDWLTEWPTDRLIGWLKVRIHGAILRAMAELHRVSTPKVVERNIACNIAAVESRPTSAHCAQQISSSIPPSAAFGAIRWRKFHCSANQISHPNLTADLIFAVVRFT